MAADSQGNEERDADSGASDTPTFEGQVIFKGDFESSDDDDT